MRAAARQALLVCAAFGVGVAPLARAQSKLVAEVGAGVEAAVEVIGAGEQGRAIVLLWALEQRCEDLLVEQQRIGTLDRLRRALANHDPLDAERRGLVADVAGQLVGEARAYVEAGWFRRAEHLMTLAEHLGVGGGAARSAVDAIRAAHVAEFLPSDPVAIRWGAAATAADSLAASGDASAIRSSALTELDGDRRLISETRIGPRFIAKVNLEFDGPALRAGLVLGYVDSAHFTIVELSIPQSGAASWSVKRLRGEKGWDVLGAGAFAVTFGSGENLTVPLTIDTLLGGVRVTVADGEEVVVADPQRGLLLPGGRLGLIASAQAGWDRRVTWSGLRLRVLASTSASTAVFDADAVLDPADVGLVDDAEDAACGLWSARVGIASLPDAAARDQQSSRVDASLEQLDPLFGRSLPALTASAVQLVTLGEQYADAGLLVAAERCLEWAARCDALVAAPALIEVRAALAEKK